MTFNDVTIKIVDGYTQVFINGEKVEGVRRIEFSSSVDEAPVIKIEAFCLRERAVSSANKS